MKKWKHDFHLFGKISQTFRIRVLSRGGGIFSLSTHIHKTGTLTSVLEKAKGQEKEGDGEEEEEEESEGWDLRWVATYFVYYHQ